MKRIKLVNWILTAYLIGASLTAIIITLSGCSASKALKSAKMNEFLECSKYEGDAGCDSCYFAVYGYYINPFTGEKTK